MTTADFAANATLEADVNALRRDTAKLVKNGVAADWAVRHPDWVATLHVDDDFMPANGKPVLLVADDGGPAILGGPWMWQHSPRRPIIRLTGFAKGRDEARLVTAEAADWVVDNKKTAGITRIEDVSDPLMTRDRATGAYLASITMPVIVRPT